jgi:hypothetical protein
MKRARGSDKLETRSQQLSGKWLRLAL